MNRSAIVATLLLLLTFTIGCKDDPSSDGLNVAINDEFKVLLWESLDGNSRSFHLNLETIKSNFCENTNIETEPSAEDDKIAISIFDISESSCNSVTFPAISNFEIGFMEKRSHNLQINLKEVIFNYGTLNVTDDYYEINMGNLNGIIIPNTRLYKVPENTIWGYVAYEASTSNNIASSFITELKSITSENVYKDGYYGYFSTEENVLTILNQDILQNYHLTFGFEFQENNDELQSILDNYRSANPDVEFKIFTSKGESL